MSDIGNAFSDSLAGLTGALSGGGAADMTGLGSGAGDISSVLSGISNAFTPASAANANAQSVDPTGAIGASLTANPPSQGTADQQQGAVGGTQSGGSTSQGGQQQGGQGQSQGDGQGQGNQQQQQSGVQQLKKAIQQLLQGRTQNAYQIGGGQTPQPPPSPAPGARAAAGYPYEGESNQREYGPGKPDLPPYSEGESNQPEYGPEGKGLPATTQQPAVPAQAPGAPGAPAGGGAGGGGAQPPATTAGSGAGLPAGGGQLPPGLGGGGGGLGGLLGAILRDNPEAAAATTAAGVMAPTPAETGELPRQYWPPTNTTPGTMQWPESTDYPKVGVPTGNAPPADPKTGLPSDPVTGKPVTPEEYRKWYNDQMKGGKKSADPTLEPTKKAPPTKVPTKKPGPAAAPAPQARPPFGGGPPPGQGLGGLLQGLMSSGLPQLAMMALMGGMGGRRGRHGHWHGGRFHPNMGHFHPRFYGPRQGGGGIDPAMMALMGGQQGGQQGGQGRPAPTMYNYQPPGGPSAGGAPYQGSGTPTDQSGGTASADDILATIRQRESGSRNIPPWQGHSASGIYQIKPETWAAWARDSGDTEAAQYQEAYQAPPEVQTRMAMWALQKYGPNATYTWAASGAAQGRPYPSLAPAYAGAPGAPNKTYLPPVQQTPQDASGGEAIAYNP